MPKYTYGDKMPEELRGYFNIDLNVHDEIVPRLPEGRKIFASWKCFTYGCPERAPKEHPFAPICYTCGQEMTRAKENGEPWQPKER